MRFLGPENASIYIIARCNERCKYCWIYSSKTKWYHKSNHRFYRELLRKNNAITFKKFKKIVDDISKINVKNLILTGDGEPFLHPRINDMIEYAFNKNLKIEIATNGTALEKSFKILNRISELKIHLVAVSKDTFSALQEKENCVDLLRKVKNNISRISYFKKKRMIGFPKIYLKVVLNKINYPEIEDFFKFASKFNINYLEFKKIRFFDHVTTLKLDKEDMQEIKKIMVGVLKSRKYKKIKTNIKEFLKTFYLENKTRQEFFCNSIYNHALIESDGTVRLCGCYFRPLTNIGNIFKKSFKDIWFSEKAEKLRKKINKNIKNKTSSSKLCYECLTNRNLKIYS